MTEPEAYDAPDPGQDAPERPSYPQVTHDITPEPVEAAVDERRNRVAQLVARVQAGDLGAIDLLR